MVKLISVYEVISSKNALEIEDGKTLFNILHEALTCNETVLLNFHEIKLIGIEFLNISIGQLYKHFDEKYIKEHLELSGIEDSSHWDLLNRVIETAKVFYKNNPRFKNNYKKLLLEKYLKICEIDEKINQLKEQRHNNLKEIDCVFDEMSKTDFNIYKTFSDEYEENLEVKFIHECKVIQINKDLSKGSGYGITLIVTENILE